MQNGSSLLKQSLQGLLVLSKDSVLIVTSWYDLNAIHEKNDHRFGVDGSSFVADVTPALFQFAKFCLPKVSQKWRRTNDTPVVWWKHIIRAAAS